MQDGATALHRACFMGNIQFAMLLVNEGKANLAKKMHKVLWHPLLVPLDRENASIDSGFLRGYHYIYVVQMGII